MQGFFELIASRCRADALCEEERAAADPVPVFREGVINKPGWRVLGAMSLGSGHTKNRLNDALGPCVPHPVDASPYAAWPRLAKAGLA